MTTEKALFIPLASTLGAVMLLLVKAYNSKGMQVDWKEEITVATWFAGACWGSWMLYVLAYWGMEYY